MVRPRPSCEEIESPGKESAAAEVEVRRGGADRDEVDVHVEAVPHSDHVAQQPAVLVDTVGLRLGDQADERAGRQ